MLDTSKIEEMGKDGVFGGVLRKMFSLYEEYLKLKGEEGRILAEINALSSKTFKGSLVYKWVKNKQGRKYFYWYIHEKDGGRTRSYYVGSRLPGRYVEGIQARNKVKMLEARLKEISGRIQEIEEKMNAVSGILG